MSVRLALPKESRPASAASNQRPRSAITPTEMRRMCAQPMRPKSARWIRPDEKEIMSSPISTFQRAAETVYKPSSSFGTGGRFDIAQAITSHFGETCGPDIGPGYDVRRSEQQTQFQFRSGIKYCPPVHPSTARQGRPLEITCEGGDPKFMPPSTFAGMATAHYNGQRAGTGMTAAMGSSSRFNGVGGLAGMGGKSYITPSATVGAKMQDIRRWPPSDPTMRIGRLAVHYSRASAERLNFAKGGAHMNFGKEGADTYCNYSSFGHCEQPRQFRPSSSMGTAAHYSPYR